jgi:hypothetical protein
MESEFIDTLSRAIALVQKASLPYHLTGGLASTFYGEPRLTQDIDVVLGIEPKHIDSFVAGCSPVYLISKDAVAEAVHTQGMFQALDQETFIKIDFHVGELVPGEFSRSRTVEFLPGLNARLVSKIDAILSKLIWVQQGSGKSKQDLLAMLAAPEEFDMVHLRQLAETLKVSVILDSVLTELNER